jgi:hypothetical protein
MTLGARLSEAGPAMLRAPRKKSVVHHVARDRNGEIRHGTQNLTYGSML